MSCFPTIFCLMFVFIRRNNNYRDILRGLGLGQRGLQQFDLTSQFHHVFWFGDLNYRLECEDEAGATVCYTNLLICQKK